jgi:hypothetical protein
MQPRRQHDRRSRPTPWLSTYWLRGRRRRGRREGEDRNIYVDRYGPWEWAAALALVGLCLADLLMTLDVLRQGGEEANPVMRWALDQGVPVFAGLKLGVTLLGALVLLLRVRFRGMRAALGILLGLYLALIGYHLALRNELRAGLPVPVAVESESPP